MKDGQRQKHPPRIVIAQVASIAFAFTLSLANQFITIAVVSVAFAVALLAIQHRWPWMRQC